jgi:polysaccharide biosynthesis/export protein
MHSLRFKLYRLRYFLLREKMVLRDEVWQRVTLVTLLLLSLAAGGCRSAMYRANNLPQEFRARPNPGDVSFNMARMTGAGYDNSLIGPDDLLNVTIVTGRDEEKPLPVAVRVSKDGSVDISPIGPVQVGNLDPVDASEQIAAAAIQRGIYLQPNVTVEFKKKAVNNITVLGAVKQPGLLEVPRNSSDVVSAIALAGGLTAEAGTEVEIIRQNIKPSNYTRFAEADAPKTSAPTEDGEIALAAYSTLSSQPPQQVTEYLAGGPVTQQINLAEVVGRNAQGDYRLDDRDVVMVRPRPKRTIHVGGLVKMPGQFELPHTEDVRLLDAIALAGGSTSIVADKVFVIRPVKGKPQPLVIQASMERAKHDGQENLVLVEGDLVSIEQTPVTAVFDSFSRLFHLTIGVSGGSFF